MPLVTAMKPVIIALQIVASALLHPQYAAMDNVSLMKTAAIVLATVVVIIHRALKGKVWIQMVIVLHRHQIVLI
jgi:hypothetical protein